MHFLFLFLDGVGLGSDDRQGNPFAVAPMPNLQRLLNGKRLVESTVRNNGAYETDSATLLGLDASLGIAGRPQSASGQAAILTGKNIPRLIGEHFGPKPNPEIQAILDQGTLFSQLVGRGKSAVLLNAFPQTYFQAIESGRRLPGVIAMSVRKAGIPLKTTADLIARQALSADFTAEGWHTRLKIPGVPILTPVEAGNRLALLATDHHFSFFEYWLTDYAGHRGDMEDACQLLATFDEMLGGLVAGWDFSNRLILITSDHGNLEEIRTRRHTNNPVPALLIGSAAMRKAFSQSLEDLTHIAPAVLKLFDQTYDGEGHSR